MAKIIDYDIEARKKLKAGIDILADAVKITLGPKGHPRSTGHLRKGDRGQGKHNDRQRPRR
jgi:hypothetical protein